MKQLSIKSDFNGDIESAVIAITKALQPLGFGILTRIDLSKKIEEKLSKSIQPTVVLGACNPKLVYEALKTTSDVALLIPCNITLRQLGPSNILIEAIRPTAMLAMLPELKNLDGLTELESEFEAAIMAIQ